MALNCKCSCEHKNVKYCKDCDKVYCEDCGREWGEKEYIYPLYPVYPIQPVIPIPAIQSGSDDITPEITW
jgi:hypothetical protein